MNIARLWRQQASNLRLLGSRCTACEKRFFPGCGRCPECGGQEMAPHQFSGLGRVLSVTTVYEAPKGFAGQVPYLAGLIELEEGPVVPAMITDAEPAEIAAGTPVEMVTRRISCDSSDAPIVYGYKFAPRETHA